MTTITSFEVLTTKIRNAGGRPKVLEALWDGDTSGWFLRVNIYVVRGILFWKTIEVKHLGIVSFGTDIRLFNGEVPEWPEAELMQEWGSRVSESLGITFYFPSKYEPDDSCPAWDQKHFAIRCKDCGKLIIPTESPYLPKDICYSCFLVREREVESGKLINPNDELIGTWENDLDDGSGLHAIWGWAIRFEAGNTGKYFYWSKNEFEEEREFEWQRLSTKIIKAKFNNDLEWTIIEYSQDIVNAPYSGKLVRMIDKNYTPNNMSQEGFWFCYGPVFKSL